METKRLILTERTDNASWSKLGYGPWDVTEKGTGAKVGYVAIALAGWPDHEPWWGVPELSLYVEEKFQAQGFGPECASAVFDWAFRTRRPPLPRILGVTLRHNENAQRMNSRLGMQLLPEVTRDVRTDRPAGHLPAEVVVFEITAEQWVGHSLTSPPEMS